MSYGQILAKGHPRVGYSDGNPTTLSIVLWSYLILSDTHVDKAMMSTRQGPWRYKQQLLHQPKNTSLKVQNFPPKLVGGFNIFEKY